MADQQHAAVAGDLVAGIDDDAVLGGEHRRALGGADVDAVIARAVGLAAECTRDPAAHRPEEAIARQGRRRRHAPALPSSFSARRDRPAPAPKADRSPPREATWTLACRGWSAPGRRAPLRELGLGAGAMPYDRTARIWRLDWLPAVAGLVRPARDKAAAMPLSAATVSGSTRYCDGNLGERLTVADLVPEPRSGSDSADGRGLSCRAWPSCLGRSRPPAGRSCSRQAPPAQGSAPQHPRLLALASAPPVGQR